MSGWRAWCLGLGGGLMAVGSAEAALAGKIADLGGGPLPAWIGFLLGNSLLAGLAILLFGGVLWLIERSRRVGLALAADANLEIEEATLNDLRVIDELSTSAFGPAASNYEQIRFIHENSFAPFWKVVRKDTDRVVGYLCVIRLSTAGERQIKDQTFNSSCPSADAMSKKNIRGGPVYVGAIFASGLRGRAVALGGLVMYLTTLKPRTIYAKPATADGLRVLRQRAFQPLHVSNLEIGAYCFRSLA